MRETGRVRWLAWGAIAAQVVFTGGWLLGDALQDAPYSAARDPISDLGALTAQHAWIILTAQAVAGVLTIAFAIWALRPSLAVDGRRPPLGPWLVAGSVLGLDNLSDAFFRLDCRTADPGCATLSILSWHAEIHDAAAILSVALAVLAPFALARRMRLVAGWRDRAPAALVFGVAFTLVVAAYLALTGSGGDGYAQRALAVAASAGVVLLALRVRLLAAQPADARLQQHRRG
jgi:Protein of unknown function (DUF998)